MRNSVNRELRVQSAITSVSFPQTLERLRAMGQKWLRLVGQDWITDMDVLSSFPAGKTVPWIAPKWLTEGDILFFYHTKTATNLIRKLRREAMSASRTGGWKQLGFVQSIDELERLRRMLERADEAALTRAGTIFAFAVVGGRPERIMDEQKHFHGTIYAPIESVHVFKRPLAADEFSHLVAIGQNTTTAVYGHQFAGLQERLARWNVLPEPLASAEPSGLGFRDVNEGNWDQVACRPDTRFIDEEQLRIYFLDFLLDEVKDSRTPLYRECACLKAGHSSGRADYFMRLGGRLVPVEAKLNVLTSPDIGEQVRQYIHVDSFTPTKGETAQASVRAGDCALCLVADQAGLYVTVDGEFICCSLQKPLFKREELTRDSAAEVREYLLQVLRTGKAHSTTLRTVKPVLAISSAPPPMPPSPLKPRASQERRPTTSLSASAATPGTPEQRETPKPGLRRAAPAIQTQTISGIAETPSSEVRPLRRIRDFYLPVLRIVHDMGGRARAEDVCQRFLARHRHQLDESFFAEVIDGDEKWHDWVHRAHYQLKQKGYFRDPQRGVWELTDKPWPEE
jgi:hypothetical protein